MTNQVKLTVEEFEQQKLAILHTMEQSQEKFGIEIEKTRTEIAQQKTRIYNASALNMFTKPGFDSSKEASNVGEELPEEEYYSPLKKSARRISSKKTSVRSLPAASVLPNTTFSEVDVAQLTGVID